MKQSDLSMMPEGLLNGLKEAEVADLIAYLRDERAGCLLEMPNDQAPMTNK